MLGGWCGRGALGTKPSGGDPVQQHSPGHSHASFAVERETRGTTQIVTVRGELDVAARHELSAVIDRAIGLLPDRVVIDLSPTTFIESSGVHCLLRAQRHASARKIDLIVIPGSGPVQRLLAMCGFEDHRSPTGPAARRSVHDQLQRKVAAARRAATYLTGGAEHEDALSKTLLPRR
jgi:anti-sigma B factor antagonist